VVGRGWVSEEGVDAWGRSEGVRRRGGGQLQLRTEPHRGHETALTAHSVECANGAGRPIGCKYSRYSSTAAARCAALQYCSRACNVIVLPSSM
jgi:hypothetical protein